MGYRVEQSEEGCRSFAPQTGGKAPSPPSSPSLVCLDWLPQLRLSGRGGATVLPAHRLRLPDTSAHIPARLFGVPLWLPLSRCLLSPVRLVRRGRSSVGLGGFRPCACPPPGFWLGAIGCRSALLGHDIPFRTALDCSRSRPHSVASPGPRGAGLRGFPAGPGLSPPVGSPSRPSASPSGRGGSPSRCRCARS